MIRGHDRRLVTVWIGLVVATLGSVLAGGWHDTGSVRVGAVVALGIAFLKVRWVGLDFMELRRAPPELRWFFEVWVAGIGTTLIGLYLLA